jgi:hypothetical protein
VAEGGPATVRAELLLAAAQAASRSQLRSLMTASHSQIAGPPERLGTYTEVEAVVNQQTVYVVEQGTRVAAIFSFLIADSGSRPD